MSSTVFRGISNQRCFPQSFYRTRSVPVSSADTIVPTAYLGINRLRCPTHRRLEYRHHFSQTKCDNVFRTFSRSFSSSNPSPSPSKIGLIGWYLGKLESHPVFTKSITSSLIYMAADLTAQMITLTSTAAFDLVRTSRMASFALLILGPSQHMWFNFVSTILPKRDLLSTLKKILMGQTLFGPIINSIFFSYNACLQGESGSQIVARLKRDLPPTLLNGLIFWPLCDFVTFKFLPVHLQPLLNSSCAYIWSIYMTYMANRNKES